MSRNGSIHIYRIIKCMNFIQWWDFHWNFNTLLWIRIATSVSFGKNWRINFPKILVKNAISNDQFYWIFGLFFKWFFKNLILLSKALQKMMNFEYHIIYIKSKPVLIYNQIDLPWTHSQCIFCMKVMSGISIYHKNT